MVELKGGGVLEISNFDKMGGHYKMKGSYFDRIPIKWGGGGGNSETIVVLK